MWSTRLHNDPPNGVHGTCNHFTCDFTILQHFFQCFFLHDVAFIGLNKCLNAFLSTPMNFRCRKLQDYGGRYHWLPCHPWKWRYSLLSIILQDPATIVASKFNYIESMQVQFPQCLIILIQFPPGRIQLSSHFPASYSTINHLGIFCCLHVFLDMLSLINIFTLHRQDGGIIINASNSPEVIIVIRTLLINIQVTIIATATANMLIQEIW